MKAVRFWYWHDAPKKYKLTNDDDKDWVAYVPKEYGDLPYHIQANDITEHKLPNGDIVFIGAHA